MTVVNDTLDLTVHGPPNPAHLVMTSGGHHWRPVQICSIKGPIPSTPPQLVLTSDWLALHERWYVDG